MLGRRGRRTTNALGLSIQQSKDKMRQAYVTEEMQSLRKKAYVHLVELGYFDPSNKELQTFPLKIKNTHYGFDNPGAPEFLEFNITVTHRPIPLFVIVRTGKFTKNTKISGKRFDPTKVNFPFIAGGAQGITIGKGGEGLYPADFKTVLETICAFDKAPVKRPVK